MTSRTKEDIKDFVTTVQLQIPIKFCTQKASRGGRRRYQK
jgi:hypothetical protein